MNDYYKEENFHMQIHYLGHPLWLWIHINYFQTWENYFKLDKEDNVMSFGCVYLHRSYIVMDPPTCGACLGSFASQKSY